MTNTTRALIWFACNPQRSLTTTNITNKFGIERGDVSKCLGKYRDTGWLATSGRGVCGDAFVWRAGPELLAEIGVAE